MIENYFFQRLSKCIQFVLTDIQQKLALDIKCGMERAVNLVKVSNVILLELFNYYEQAKLTKFLLVVIYRFGIVLHSIITNT